MRPFCLFLELVQRPLVGKHVLSCFRHHSGLPLRYTSQCQGGRWISADLALMPPTGSCQWQFRLGAEVGAETPLEDVVESWDRPEPLETVDGRRLSTGLWKSCQFVPTTRPSGAGFPAPDETCVEI
jgi:hypothetical protein